MAIGETATSPPAGLFARGSFAERCFWACVILWGLEVMDLFNVSRAFDPGDLLAALLGVGLAWSVHRAVWTRRFPEPVR